MVKKKTPKKPSSTKKAKGAFDQKKPSTKKIKQPKNAMGGSVC